jgi:ABC-type dipeptide/oligopeptide/nickel transport system ATPase subunit
VNLKANILVQAMIDKKQPENEECFQYLCILITKDARCTREMKSRIAMEKKNSIQQEDSVYKQMGLTFKEENSEMLRSVLFLWCCKLDT